MARTRKAVLIRPSNLKYLADRFAQTDETSLQVGYFLVADFDSQDQMYEVLTPGVLKEKYAWTGKKLENEFLEMVERSGDAGN